MNNTVNEDLIYEDFLGNEIREGDKIAYPVRMGSSMWIQTRQVISKEVFVNWSEVLGQPRLKVKKKNGNITRITVLNRCIIFQQFGERLLNARN